MQRVLDYISSALMIVAGVALIAMMVQVTADVVGKFLLNMPVPVTLELVSNYYMVAVVFLPFAAVERMDGNIHVELIYTHLPRIGQRLLEILGYSLGIFLFGLLTVMGWESAMKKYEVGEFIMGTYPIEIWQSRFLVPIGCALALVLMVLKLSRTVVRLFRPDLDRPDEDDRRPDADDPVSGTNI